MVKETTRANFLVRHRSRYIDIRNIVRPHEENGGGGAKKRLSIPPSTFPTTGPRRKRRRRGDRWRVNEDFDHPRHRSYDRRHGGDDSDGNDRRQ